MSFDIVDTLEIPQGATELTTSELKQISGGHQQQNHCQNHQRNNCHEQHKQCKQNEQNERCQNKERR